MTPPSRPAVRVLAAGAALSLASVACVDKGPAPTAERPPTRTSNPPLPEPEGNPPMPAPEATEPPPTPAEAEPSSETTATPSPEAADAEEATADAAGTAAALPAWEDVQSNHPAGATNPPVPVLEVTEDATRCFKHWQSPMVRDPELLAVGGRVLASADQAKGTEVACDPQQAQALLDRHAKHAASGAKSGPSRSGE